MLSGDPCNGLSGSTSALRCSYEVSYNNQCGSSKSITELLLVGMIMDKPLRLEVLP